MRNLVLIPAYNEEEALPGTLAQLQDLPKGFEILLINDGSQDRTHQVVQQAARKLRLPFHLLELPMNCGIGAAVQTGYLFAARDGGYRYVIQLDADGQHDPADIPRLVQECEHSGLDLCVGSRFLDRDRASFRSDFKRRLGIRFFVWLIGLLSGARVTDPTSGFRCAGPRSWERFAQHYPEDYPEPESLFWCARNRLRIGEVPVCMRPRQGGRSSIYSARAMYYMFKVSLAILLDRIRTREQAP
jgi:glycosyltransferase involved in cell wall biosynthesis